MTQIHFILLKQHFSPVLTKNSSDCQVPRAEITAFMVFTIHDLLFFLYSPICLHLYEGRAEIPTALIFGKNA